MITKILMLGLLVAAVAATVYFGVFVRPLPFYWLFAAETPLVLHVAAFACLSILALLIWPNPLLVFLALTCIGGAIEAAHLLDPTREGSLKDMAVNTGGIVLGALLFFVVRQFVKIVRSTIVRSTNSD